LGGENQVAINILASTIRHKLGIEKDHYVVAPF